MRGRSRARARTDQVSDEDPDESEGEDSMEEECEVFPFFFAGPDFDVKDVSESSGSMPMIPAASSVSLGSSAN